MKDLYLRNGLTPYESDRSKITNSTAEAPEDYEACIAILLNQERKQEYDTVHSALSAIGFARHFCKVKNPRWDKEHADFLPVYDTLVNSSKASAKKSAHADLEKAAKKGLPVTVAVLGLVALVILMRMVMPGAAQLAEPYAETKKMHVVVSDGLIYPEMNKKSQPLAELIRYEDIRVSAGSTDDVWYFGSVENVEGYILQSALKEGPADYSILDDCRTAGVQRPETGVIQARGEMGNNVLSLANPPGKDVVAKLKTLEGETTFIVYLRADSKLQVEGVPEGVQYIEYATGDNYSPSCALFVDNLQIVRDPKTFNFFTTILAEREFPANLSYMLKTEIFDVIPVPIKQF